MVEIAKHSLHEHTFNFVSIVPHAVSPSFDGAILKRVCSSPHETQLKRLFNKARRNERSKALTELGMQLAAMTERS